ncbi:hypothetical protein AAFF_G00090380 [Aldrovandia affinis]|uniref:Uncharacterized protein n=1 Tax=Aldrovandia affinis TaxID=143900 RepID=A0AAD7WC89_9TELE|nr:hypothetical protein AAFF_G00090380 [Aldrovandia affinis]
MVPAAFLPERSGAAGVRTSAVPQQTHSMAPRPHSRRDGAEPARANLINCYCNASKFHYELALPKALSKRKSEDKKARPGPDPLCLESQLEAC